jgi:galactonate dehydratase
MRITDFRTYPVGVGPRRTWLFVEVLTDEGLVGLGEASQSRNDAGVIRDLEQLRPQYIGHDPFDLIEGRAHLLDWPYVGRTLFAAVSALEQASWDLIGKRLERPVYQLLGGKCREGLRAYANMGFALHEGTNEELARVAKDAVASGFTALKFYPFGERPGGSRDGGTDRRWLELGLERVRIVREAVGPDVDILIDLMHQFFDFQEARQVARELETVGLYWIEDPFSSDDPQRLARFRREAQVRIAGGSPYITRREFGPLLEAQSFDVVMPDVKWLGGILAAKKAASMADVYDVACSPHNASGPVASAASVHLSFTLSNFSILEYAWAEPPWREELCRGTETLVNGIFIPPTSPGLGIELDAKVAAKHRVE